MGVEKTEGKAEWRKKCRVLRQAVSAEREAALCRVLASFLQELPDGTLLGIYWPMRHEPDIRSVATAWQKERGGSLAIPAVEQGVMAYRLWHPDGPMTTDACGMNVPAGPEVLPDVLLVPCLGFSPEGHRLGYGGGYFDRYLAAYRSVRRVLLAYDEQCVPSALFEAHDLRFDGRLSDCGCTFFEQI